MMKYPEVEVKKIITDFRNCQKDGFFEVVDSELKRLDISMLVNNVGVLSQSKFIEEPDKEVFDMFNINLMTSVMMTKKMLPRMLGRGHKNAIITVSDNEGLSTIPIFTNAYGTTKSALIYFMNSLQKEFGDRIDFLTLTPIRIAGGKDFNEQLGWTAADPDCYVNCAFKRLGNVSQSFGSWKQGMWSLWFNNFKMARDVNLPNWEGVKKKLWINKLPTWGGMKQSVKNRMPTWAGIKQKLGMRIKTE